MSAVMTRQLFLLCFVVSVGLILTNLSDAGSCGCPPLWTGFQGMCYRYFSASSVTWLEAERQCQSYTKPCWDEGATTGQISHLVSIHSQDEMDFLITLFDSIRNKRFSGKHLVWIGLNDKTTEGSYAWSDGSEFNYTFWHTDQPNNYNNAQDCVNFGVEFDFMWNDSSCEPNAEWVVEGYICKLGQWV